MDVYVNYPNSRFTIHNNSNCNQIHKHSKSNQRIISINNNNFIQELTRFINQQYVFSSTAGQNDMWMEINLLTSQHSLYLAFIFQQILGSHYKPLSNAPITIHC